MNPSPNPPCQLPTGTLREEDLVVGKPYIHPGTYLEYADFHQYLLGDDPLPHWRNTYVRGKAWLNSQAQTPRQRYEFACTHFDCYGNPLSRVSLALDAICRNAVADHERFCSQFTRA